MNYHDTNLFVGQVGIELRCLSNEIVHRAGRFRAGKSATRDHEREPLASYRRVGLQGRFLQERHHPISQQRRVAEILHRHRPIADPGVIEEICLRTEREEQVIEFELELAAFDSMNAPNFTRVKIDIFHVGFDHIYVTQNSPQRIHDVARGKIARRDFMQHRSKQNEILPRDQGYLDVRPTREMLVQILCGIKPGEAAACDYDLGLFHVKSLRAARRCCERRCFSTQHNQRAWLQERVSEQGCGAVLPAEPGSPRCAPRDC